MVPSATAASSGEPTTIRLSATGSLQGNVSHVPTGSVRQSKPQSQGYAARALSRPLRPRSDPALLRQLFRLGCDYSGQVVSYQKLVGQLQDAGNTTTLAHYLQLLRGAGMLAGLDKFSGSRVRQRGSSPKLLTLNTALATAMSGETPGAIRADPRRGDDSSRRRWEPTWSTRRGRAST